MTALAKLSALCAVALMLAGCASTPPRTERLPAPDTARPAPAPAPQARPPAPATPPVVQKPEGQKRGGGYYLDDGPGDDAPPPEVLAAIPDAQPKVEPLHRFANKPYSVFGKDYTPRREHGAYKARGRASWYGRKFHGQKTASGEIYDMYAMTAAHPTLPIPSYARVTNLDNGRSVVVRVNDRGPFHSARIMDLSYAAAYKLGYINDGTTAVEVESLLPEDIQLAGQGGTSPAAGDPLLVLVEGSAAADAADPDGAGGVYLQLAAFSGRANADAYVDHLRRELPWLEEPIRVQSGGGRYRLHVGPYADDGAAHRVAARIRESLDVVPIVVRP